MQILAFVVLAALGLVVLLTYTRSQRNRDRWPYNLDKRDAPDIGGTNTTWSPTTDTAIVTGALVLNDTLPSGQADQSSPDRDAAADSASSSWSEHGATGSWDDADTPGDADTSGGTDSGGGDSDSGGDSGGGSD